LRTVEPSRKWQTRCGREPVMMELEGESEESRRKGAGELWE
jgi:hypothetical protein